MTERVAQQSEWLTVTEAAADAKVGTKLIYTNVRRGRLKAARLGRVLRIHRTWLTDWLVAAAERR